VTKDERLVLVQPRVVRQRLLLAGLAAERGVGN
jgi:hypothetical protein